MPCKFAVTLCVQNIDARAKTLKVRPPKLKYFQLKGFFAPTKLAAGLETKVEVSSVVLVKTFA